MTRSNTAIFILLVTVFTASGAAQGGDTVEELKACARVTNEEARHACFDDLGERVLREEAAERNSTPDEAARPVAATATATKAQPLPDDLGSSKAEEYVGHITSCKQGGRGDWYFFFENGQIWKEVNKRNLRFKECDFQATIMTDAFGYKMRIDSMDRTVRVKRHR